MMITPSKKYVSVSHSLPANPRDSQARHVEDASALRTTAPSTSTRWQPGPEQPKSPRAHGPDQHLIRPPSLSEVTCQSGGLLTPAELAAQVTTAAVRTLSKAELNALADRVASHMGQNGWNAAEFADCVVAWGKSLARTPRDPYEAARCVMAAVSFVFVGAFKAAQSMPASGQAAGEVLSLAKNTLYRLLGYGQVEAENKSRWAIRTYLEDGRREGLICRILAELELSGLGCVSPPEDTMTIWQEGDVLAYGFDIIFDRIKPMDLDP